MFGRFLRLFHCRRATTPPVLVEPILFEPVLVELDPEPELVVDDAPAQPAYSEEVCELTTGAYPDCESYLRDELVRIDCLIKAYLIRRRVHFHEAAADPIRGVTAHGFGWVIPLTNPDGRAETDRLARKARHCERVIVERLRSTDDRTRSTFPIWELTKMFDLIPALAEVVPPFGRIPNASRHRDTDPLDVLLLALAFDRIPRYGAALAALGDEGLTAGMVLETLHPEVPATSARWHPFDPAGPLVSNGLVELGTSEAPLRRRVRIDPRVADFMLGLSARTPDLPGVRIVAEARAWGRLHLDPETRSILNHLSARWWDRKHPLRLMLLLHGPYGSPILPAIQAFLTAAIDGHLRAMLLLVVDVPEAVKALDWDGLVRRIYREALFRRIPVFWQAAECLLAADQPPGRWEIVVRRAEQSPYPTFVASEIAWDPVRSFASPDRYFARVEFPIPSLDTRRAIWKERLALERNPLADDASPVSKTALDLLETFPFTEGQIEDSVATARGLGLAVDPRVPVATPEHLYEGCRRQSARRLVTYAQRIQPRPGQVQFEDVVLPPPAALQLKEMLGRMRTLSRVYRGLGFEQRLSLGRGLVALFTGPSGTGKTHAATVLASIVGKDLYKVDVAQVVSKFVGETEKNLNRVFADAQDANAVLFFDEADALFGKRGDVQQGQDRWANMEVNFLLQRVEEYTGTVILATNFRQNIDEAFLRRVQVLLEFPKPDSTARFGILKRMFPDEVLPPPDEDLKKLADLFDLTGGSLKNAVLDSAFRAAEMPKGERVVITTDQLVLGIAREYQKIGRPITPGVFTRGYYDLVVRELQLVKSPDPSPVEPTRPALSRRASG